MGLDIVFQFSDGGVATSHMLYSSWSTKFSKYLTSEEDDKCFQDKLSGECTDKCLCLKVYIMVIAKNYLQEGLRTDDYPVRMKFC